MLTTLLTTLVLVATAAAAPDPLQDALIQATHPQYVASTGVLDATRSVVLANADRRADGTAVLILADGATPKRDSMSLAGRHVTLYALKASGSTWAVTSSVPLGDLSEGEPEVSVKAEGRALTPTEHLVEADVDTQSVGEGNSYALGLYRLSGGVLTKVLECDSGSGGDGYPANSSTCKVRGSSPGSFTVSQSTESCADPDTMCTSSNQVTVYHWSGTKLDVVSSTAGGSDPLVKAATASSILADPKLGPDYYAADRAVDGVQKTAWAEGVPGPGVGQWIRFEFVRAVNLSGFRLLAGCGANPSRRKLNERLQSLRVTADGDATQVIELKDKMVTQDVRLNLPKATTTLKLEVLAVYPGQKYEDACLSEIAFIEAR